MNFDFIENLEEYKIKEMYNDILEEGQNISYICYFYDVRCLSGKYLRNVSADTTSMNDGCGYMNRYYKQYCYTCYQVGCGGNYQSGATLTGYCAC